MAVVPQGTRLPALQTWPPSPILMEREYETLQGSYRQIQEADAPGIQ